MPDEKEDRLTWGEGSLEIVPPDEVEEPEDATEEEEKNAEKAKTVTLYVPE